MIRLLDCEMETEMVVGWFEVEYEWFEVLCGTVLVRREHGL